MQSSVWAQYGHCPLAGTVGMQPPIEGTQISLNPVVEDHLVSMVIHSTLFTSSQCLFSAKHTGSFTNVHLRAEWTKLFNSAWNNHKKKCYKLLMICHNYPQSNRIYLKTFHFLFHACDMTAAKRILEFERKYVHTCCTFMWPCMLHHLRVVWMEPHEWRRTMKDFNAKS